MTRIASATLETPSLGLAERIAARLGDYLELAKPRIVALELITVAVAAYVAAPRGLDAWVLLHAVVGAALIAASAGAANQWLERGTDARMRRTAARPLPAGRLGSGEVLLLAAVSLVLGTVQLALLVNLLTAVLGIATWLIYVAVYTPLKVVTPINTAVGAVSGALPILMGWTATGAPLDARAFALAGVLFMWQFPHFMAIAWLHREDYARAGQRMLTVVDPTGLRAGAQAVIAALVLIPVSLIPALTPTSASPSVYCGWAIALGAAQFAAAVAFLLTRNETSARRLLRATLLYLPCWMALLVMLAI